jgi:hypothetical protein
MWKLEIGSEAAQFLFWKYLNGILVAVKVKARTHLKEHPAI